MAVAILIEPYDAMLHARVSRVACKHLLANLSQPYLRQNILPKLRFRHFLFKGCTLLTLYASCQFLLLLHVASIRGCNVAFCMLDNFLYEGVILSNPNADDLSFDLKGFWPVSKDVGMPAARLLFVRRQRRRPYGKVNR
jgi:hypothetical protein